MRTTRFLGLFPSPGLVSLGHPLPAGEGWSFVWRSKRSGILKVRPRFFRRQLTLGSRVPFRALFHLVPDVAKNLQQRFVGMGGFEFEAGQP